MFRRTPIRTAHLFILIFIFLLELPSRQVQNPYSETSISMLEIISYLMCELRWMLAYEKSNNAREFFRGKYNPYFVSTHPVYKENFKTYWK